jgi:hypothetical protein
LVEVKNRNMTESLTKGVHPALVGKYGMETAIVGELLILLDGIYVLATNSVLAPSLGGPAVVGWSQIVLALLMLGTEYYYKSHAVAVAWTVGVLALLAYAFDGGFFFVGATLALIGAILTGYKK